MRTMRQLMSKMPDDGKARHLLREFNNSSSQHGRPVSVKRLAERLGLDVHVVRLPSGMTGRLVSDGLTKAGYRIEVSDRATLLARRWAVLHELGHYFLHRNAEYDFLASDAAFDASGRTFYEDKAQEREANQFASVLLFSDGAIASAVSVYGRNCEALSRRFGVTENMIKVALREYAS